MNIEAFTKSISRTLGVFAVVSTMAIMSPSMGQAAPIALDFSFDGVSGTFYGLDDATAGAQMATTFDFNGIFGTYVGISAATNPIGNTFVFLSGEVSSISFFQSLSTPSSAPGTSGILTQLFMLFSVPQQRPFAPPPPPQLADSTELFGIVEEYSLGQLTIEKRELTTVVPLPAGGLLLLSGLIGITALRRRKKNAA